MLLLLIIIIIFACCAELGLGLVYEVAPGESVYDLIFCLLDILFLLFLFILAAHLLDVR